MTEEDEFDYRKALILPVNSKGELFIQDRRGHKKPDWGYFGGGMEEGETPLETVIRESKEELCLDLKEEDLIYLGPSVTNWDGTKIIRHIYLYHTDQPEFEVKEGKAGHWFSFDEVNDHLEKEDLFDEVRVLIKSNPKG